MISRLILGIVVLGVLLGVCPPVSGEPGEQRLRIATFNIQDAGTEAITSGRDERLKRVAEVILDIRPDIILLNEIDQDAACSNGQRFADGYLAAEAGPRAPIRYRAYMRPSNTGVHSGFDLDNNGVIDQQQGSRDYGGDCLGYGEHPGQYGMTLLVREGLTIDESRVRTFRSFLWKDMPSALLPPMTDGAGSWYTDEELAVLPLSSKSHWDVPVILENGATVHILASHPTPPVFDGPEDRNGRRNHDEIRFWADYISGGDDAVYIVDDAGARGGLHADANFVIVGDLNADPEKGDSRGNPMQLLLAHERVAKAEPPFSTTPVRTSRRNEVVTLTDFDTSRFAMRIDYALPSSGVRVVGSRVYRHPLDIEVPSHARHGELGIEMDERFATTEWTFPSDHFPVFVDLAVPPPPPSPPEDATITPVPSGKNP